MRTRRRRRRYIHITDKVEQAMAKSASDFDRYRLPAVARGYSVDMVPGCSCPWRVSFVVDGVSVGFAQFQTQSQADDAGVDFMFSGWGDV